MAGLQGVDYSFARPGAAAIKAAGFGFVCRYLASSPGKVITTDEVNDLHAHELPIVLVFEDYANQALNGFGQGQADAREALNQSVSVGLPADRPIYFAVDFDANPQQQTSIDDYLRGAASIIGEGRVGIYGGYWVVKRCLDAGTAKWGWQTVAWSGGQVDPRVHIYQNGQSAFNGGCDIDEARQPDFGQWPIGGVDMVNTNDVSDLFVGILFRTPSAEEVDRYAGKVSGGDLARELNGCAERAALLSTLLVDEEAVRILAVTVLERPEPLTTTDDLKTHIGGHATEKIKEFYYSDEGKAAATWRRNIRATNTTLAKPLPQLTNNVPSQGDKIPVTVVPPKPKQPSFFANLWHILVG